MKADLCFALENVRKSYEIDTQKVEALRGVNLTVSRGKAIAVTGKSGAGKSTLLHMVGTLDRPSSGRVLLGDQEVSTISDIKISAIRNREVGFVFQSHNLLPEFTALENVMLPALISQAPRAAVTDRARQLLQSVGLNERINHLPSELSGGEQQRVAIARSLIMTPRLILADEPTGNLDRKTSMAIQELLIELVNTLNINLLLVTHDLELAKRFPHNLVMEDGLIVEGPTQL